MATNQNRTTPKYHILKGNDTPNPLESDNQYDRYYHYDLPEAELTDLRVHELEVEIAKRKYSDSQLPQAKPKARPKRLAEGVKL
jgi:hypothetical protein